MMASDEEAGHPDFSEEEIRQHKEPISNGGDIESAPEDFSIHPAAHENWVTVANRVLLSKTYFVIYICIILLSLVTMIWTLVDPAPDLFLFWIIEFIIIGSLVFEVGVKMVAAGPKRYFGHWSNWIDIAVIVMVMVTLVVYMHSVHRAKHGQATLEEDIGLAVLIVRNLAMILRIIIMLKNQRQRSSEASTRVDFMMLREEPDDLKSMMEGDEDDRQSGDSDSDEENPL